MNVEYTFNMFSRNVVSFAQITQINFDVMFGAYS